MTVFALLSWSYRHLKLDYFIKIMEIELRNIWLMHVQVLVLSPSSKISSFCWLKLLKLKDCIHTLYIVYKFRAVSLKKEAIWLFGALLTIFRALNKSSILLENDWLINQSLNNLFFADKATWPNLEDGYIL